MAMIMRVRSRLAIMFLLLPAAVLGGCRDEPSPAPKPGASIQDKLTYHRFTAFAQDPALMTELDEAFAFIPASPNRLQNGSFELGLGAEPFHPGWAPVSRGKGQPLTSFTPPGPVIDNGQSADGLSSLKLTIPAGPYRCWLYVTPPAGLGPDELRKFNFYAKADHGAVKAKVGAYAYEGYIPSTTHTLGKEWAHYQANIVVSNTSYKLMVEFKQTGDTSKPTEIWIDAVQWLDVDNKVAIDETPEVEMNFLPKNRQGIHWAGESFSLPLAGRCKTARTLDIAFYAKDVSRPGVIHKPWTAKVTCKPGEVFNKQITSPKLLPRGAYVGLLVARDASDQSIVGTARRYFSVIKDLTGVTPPDFKLGCLQGIRNWGDEFEFNWHGGWDPDDNYKLMYQTGIRAHVVETHWAYLEPKEGVFNWYLDGDMKAAARNGCIHLLVHLGTPGSMKAEEYKNPDPTADYFGLPGWMVPKSTVIPMKNRHGAARFPNAKNKVLLLPPPEKLVELFTKIVTRWGSDELEAVLSYAEINLMMQPDYYVDNVLSHIYGPVKAASPETELIFGVSYDFDDNEKSYINRVFDAGGLNFCDGVSTHNYGRPIISSNGISAITGFASRIDGKTNKFGKPLVMGQTAVGGISSHNGGRKAYQHHGWDLAQRELADVGAGARWSAGDSVFYSFWNIGMQNNMQHFRGPLLAPGPSAVANNAIYSILAGAKGEGLIELDPKLLIATFSSSNHYFAALACTDKNNAWVQVDTQLKDLKNLELFDLWGEPIPFDGNLVVDKEAIYLKTTDPRLFSRLSSARLNWTANLMAVNLKGNYNDPIDLWKMAKTGTMDIEFGVSIVAFDVLEAELLSGTPITAGIIGPDGKKKSAAGKWSPIEPTYLASCIPLAKPDGPLPGEIYAWSSLYSPTAKTINLLFSMAFISNAELWINGVRKNSWTLPENHHLGSEWLTERVAFSAGMNNILLVLTPRGGGKPIFQVRAVNAGGSEGGRLTEAPGVKMVQTKLSGPGQLFKPEDMWKNPIVAKWRTFRESTYNLDFTFRDGKSYPLSGIEIEVKSPYWSYGPSDWSFYGSHDGANWVLMDKQTNVTWAPHTEIQVFKFNNPKSYAHYRWHLPGEKKPKELFRLIKHIHLIRDAATPKSDAGKGEASGSGRIHIRSATMSLLAPAAWPFCDAKDAKHWRARQSPNCPDNCIAVVGIPYRIDNLNQFIPRPRSS
jgi:hypothetical protein